MFQMNWSYKGMGYQSPSLISCIENTACQVFFSFESCKDNHFSNSYQKMCLPFMPTPLDQVLHVLVELCTHVQGSLVVK